MNEIAIRSFVAIDIPEDIKFKIFDGYEKYRKMIKASWVKPENLHITIKFMGDCSPDLIRNLNVELESRLTGFGKFNILIGGYGAFPGAKNARVLWVKTESVSEKLIEVCNLVNSATSKMGILKEIRKPTPHITIARIRDPITLDLSEINESAELHEFSCREVVIFKSTLTRSGSIYETINKIMI